MSQPRTKNPMMHEAPNDAETGVLHQTIAELRERLIESQEALCAIRSGGVDAITVPTSAGMQVFSLNGADRPYRDMVEIIKYWWWQ